MHKRGFTLVELLIVIVVIAILAAITIVAYTGVQSRARATVLESDVANAVTTLEATGAQSGSYPATQTAANLKASSGTTLNYTYAGTGYCVSATNGTQTYYATNGNNAPQVGDCPTTNGLVGWWPMNGSADDQSGSGNVETIAGPTLASGMNNQLNGAYTFASSSAQYIDTGSVFPLQNFTVSLWINPTGQAGGGNTFAVPISNSRDCCTVNNGFQIDYTTPATTTFTPRARLWAGGTGPAATITSSLTAPINSWTLLTITYNSSTFALYVNGQSGGSVGTGVTVGTSAYDVYLGRMGFTTGYGFVGTMDDVRIYNRALSAAEIATIYADQAL